jgi:hypothetical protein
MGIYTQKDKATKAERYLNERAWSEWKDDKEHSFKMKKNHNYHDAYWIEDINLDEFDHEKYGLQ